MTDALPPAATVVGHLDPQALAKATRRAVTRALAEDLGERGDVTARATVPAVVSGEAEIVARAPGVVSGLAAIVETFAAVDPRIVVEVQLSDGDRVIPDQVIAVVTGPMRAILSGERTALNFLSHLSGIATATARLQDLIADTGCQIRDTRKTTPGLRLLEKAAVLDGGGANHRIGLYDAVLVKENHILAAGGLAEALASLRRADPGVAIQVEVETPEEIWTALDHGVTDILLDNFSVEEVRLAAKRVERRASLEVSGNLTEETVRAYAEAVGPGGRLAVGAITHSAPALDVALDVVEQHPRAVVQRSPSDRGAALPSTPQAPSAPVEELDIFGTRDREPQASSIGPAEPAASLDLSDLPAPSGPSTALREASEAESARSAEELDEGVAQGAPFSWRQSPFKQRRQRED